MERAWLRSDGRFGARLARAALGREGMDLTLYRVRRIMAELGIRGVVRRNFCPAVPATVPCGDITHLGTGEGWLCLATVIDLCTRMVVGWAMGGRVTADLAVSALDMARRAGYVTEGAILNSGRESQHTSRELADWAHANDVRLSAGRAGSCRDNAVAEPLFATLRNETCSLRSWATRAEARAAVCGFIEGYYNRARPHPSIGCEVPAERMAAFMARCDAAISEPGEAGGCFRSPHSSCRSRVLNIETDHAGGAPP